MIVCTLFIVGFEAILIFFFCFYLFTVPLKEKFLLVVEGEFQITNIPYTIGFVNRNSSEFLALSANITTQVIIIGYWLQSSMRTIFLSSNDTIVVSDL